MIAAVSILVFTAAFALVLHVLAGTLWPARARIVAICRGRAQ